MLHLLGFFGTYILPLFHTTGFSFERYPISYEGVESSGFVTDVSEDGSAISPEDLSRLSCNSLCSILLIWTARTAAVRSSQGMVVCFSGATQAFPRRNATCTLSTLCDFTYETVPYLSWLASEKCWKVWGLPKVLGLKHRCILKSAIRWRSFNQPDHCSENWCEITLSHPRFLLQSSCNKNLAGTVNRATQPKGSYRELTTDKIHLLVCGWSCTVVLNFKLSVSMHYCSPNALCGQLISV